MDEQNCVNRIGELAQAAWALRDSMLEQSSISPDIVRLEESIHQLEMCLGYLASVLGADQPTFPPPRTV
jgi:hypothetical protein